MARLGAKTELFSEWQKGTLVVADQGLSTGQRFWVCSVNGSDTAGHGRSPEAPAATLNYAVSLTTGNRFDVIYLMPGHVETIAAAANNPIINTIGTKVVGLGNGDDRPTFIFTTDVNANMIVGATNVWLENILFVNGIDNQVEVLDINFCDCTVKDCEFREGAASQALTYIDINGGGANAADRPKLFHNKIVSEAAGAVNAIEIGQVEDGIVIEGNWITGDFSDAAISSGSICTNMLISGNYIRNVNAGDWAIELTGAATGLCVGNRLMSDSLATCLDPGSLMCVENYATNAIDRSSVPLPALPATAWMDANYIGNGAIDRAAFATDATELMGDGIVVTRAAGALPQTGALSLFTITGHVLLKRVLGVVTVDVGAVANNTKLVNNSTGAGATTDICGTNNITGDVADTQYTITGTFADAMIATTNLPLAASVDLNILLVPGTLQVDCAGSDGGGGRVRWSVLYQPLEEGASIVAA